MRRVTIVLWQGGIGGAETQAVTLAAALDEAGWPAEVVTLTDGHELDGLIREYGVRSRCLGVRRGAHAYLRPRRLAAFIQATGPGAVILPGAGLLAGSLRAGGYRGPLIGVEHGSLLNADVRSVGERVADRLGRRVARTALDAQVGVSDYIAERIRRVPHADNVVRIHNGVDTRRFRPAARPEAGDGVVFGFAGRLVAGKGVRRLLDGLEALEVDRPVRLLVAGDGPLRAELQDRALRMAPHRVELLGWVTDMPAFWARCDVALVSSAGLVEAFCLAAAEAMASGCPVIATAGGAVPEVVGSGGCILGSGTPAAWSGAMRSYALSPERRRSDGLAARERVERHFDIALTARAYVDLIERIATTRRATAGSRRSRVRA